MYIVTIKLPKNPAHDPRNKRVGPCPVSTHCTDVTGEHHSLLVSVDELPAIRQRFSHITRIEEVGL